MQNQKKGGNMEI